MKRRLIILVVGLLMLFSAHSAMASYSDERWQYTDAGVQQERCTYRCWHEAYDRLGISLPLTWGNAATWAANARNDGYTVDNTPTANSIVCWSGNTWGHVAYVTGVDSTKVYIREAGINPVNGLYYQDTSYSISNQNRWSGYTLQGYIHLVSNKIQLWNVSASELYSGTVQFWAKKNDNDPINNAVFYMDDIAITTNLVSDEDGFYSVSVDTTAYGNGEHQLSIHYTNSTSDEWSICRVNFHNNYCGGKALWSLDANGTLTISGTGAITSCPWDAESIVSVVIEDGITSICDNAFMGCTGLKQIHLPGSITSIGYYAFQNCINLSEAVFPEETNGLTIGYYAFSGCSSLKSIRLPEGITQIQSSVFFDCFSLESVILPSSLKSIYNSAFRNCSSLVAVSFGNGLENIYEYAFENCSSLDVDIPNTVTRIENAAFRNCSSLSNITLPEGLVDLKESVFSGCVGLKTVTFREGLKSIGNSSFAECSNLSRVDFPDSLTSISFSAFKNCSSITEITIPDGVTSISNGAFSGCAKLQSIHLHDHITELGSFAFEDCLSLRTIEVPETVQNMDCTTFSNCASLERIAVADTNPYFISIDGVVFDHAVSKLLIFPAGKTGEYTIPSGVTGIELAAFRYCRKMTEVIMPDSISYVGDDAFSGCSGLSRIVLSEGLTRLNYSVFSRCSSLIRIDIPAGIQTISAYAFSGCTSLERFEIPSGVTKISSGVFSDCKSMRSLTLPKSVTGIDSGAFWGCDSLTDVYYAGTREEWHSVQIDLFDNSGIQEAAIHFADDIPDDVVPSETDINESVFPDLIFRSIVKQFDTNNDDHLSEEELSAVTEMDCSNRGISTIKGIEYFFSLTHLTCSQNQLTSLDVHHNAKLTMLSCWENSISDLKLCRQTNNKLQFLYCWDNKISSLDLSYHPHIERVDCYNNQLTSINTAYCDYLDQIFCRNNMLTVLDFSGNGNLWEIDCSNNRLTSLTLSSQSGTGERTLHSLDCSNNQLLSLDLSYCSDLTSLICSDNSLSTLNLGNCPNLYYLSCYSNHISGLDVTNCPSLANAVQMGTRTNTGWYDYFIADGGNLYFDQHVFITAGGTISGPSNLSADYVLPDLLTRIEDEAFSGILNRVFYIPRSVTYISGSAFENSVIILCPASSYAESRCRELGLHVIIED